MGTGSYVQNNPNVGRGYDAIRLQMEGFKLITSTKREANDSDIWDFRSLSTAVENREY